RKRSFKSGDNVWVHDTSRRPGVCTKLSVNWKGPFIVTKKIDDLVYLVKGSATSPAKSIHIDRLTAYKCSSLPAWLVTMKSSVCTKLSVNWKGPFIVTKKIDDLVYLVKGSATSPAKSIHIDRLTAYKCSSLPAWLVTMKSSVCTKLSVNWKGPFIVTKKIDDLVYLVKGSATSPAKSIHIDRLTAYKCSSLPAWLVTMKSSVCTKLSVNWKGPFIVTKKIDDLVYLVKGSATSPAKSIHIDRLTAYKCSSLPAWLVTMKSSVCTKLSVNWKGPFIVTKKIDDLVYLVKGSATSPAKSIHIDRLTAYKCSSLPAWLVTMKSSVCTKLSVNWKGPFIVTKKIDDLVYLVKGSATSPAKSIHIDRLTAYKCSSLPAWLVTMKSSFK
ncbi:hypothetical protein MAR_023398, partial [Mya arenaria]